MRSSPEIPYIPINPVSLVCPRCSAKAGQACHVLKSELQVVHVERIKAAAVKDVAAKNALGK